MIRQEIFNNIIASNMQIMHENTPEVVNLYVAYRMANAMSQRGVVPVAKLDGQAEVALNNLQVIEGRFVADFIDMRQQNRWSEAEILFTNGLRILARNTWVDPVVEAPAETTEGDPDGKRTDERTARRPAMRGGRERALRASEIMSQVDEYLVGWIYDMAMGEGLTLVTQGRNMYQRPANQSLVEGIVYHTAEDNRLLAAHELLQYCKPSLTDPDQGMKDIIVRNVLTGVIEFGFSGQYGTEQQWIEEVGKRCGRSGSSRPREEVELTDFERGFFDYFREHCDAAVNPELAERLRHSARNRY